MNKVYKASIIEGAILIICSLVQKNWYLWNNASHDLNSFCSNESAKGGK